MSVTLRMKDGDLFISSAGRAELVDGADKAAQDVAEVLMTPLDSLRDYGSELASLNIPEPVSVIAGKALVSKKVDEAIQRLKRFQETDPFITDSEQIDKINKLVVQQIGTGQFIFWINLFLVNQSITGNQVLAVSLRHQESARVAETAVDLARRLSKTR